MNGDRITEAILRDGDVLQVGPFSFRMAVPAAPSVGPVRREQRYKHLERSRRNLARFVLAQRKKLQSLQQAMLGDSGPEPLDLQQKASGLRQRYREFEKRIRLLEQGERELSKDREAFNQERNDHWAKMKEAEQERDRRQQEAHAELEARRQELLNREKSMSETRQDPSEAFALLEQQRRAQEQAEKSLREQRAELVRMMADLRNMHEAMRSQKNGDVQALREENERLRLELAQSASGAATEAPSRLLDECKEFQEENQRLRQLLQEQRELLDELKTAPSAPAAPRENPDLDHFEAELNSYRQQLEADRQKLDEDMQQIRRSWTKPRAKWKWTSPANAPSWPANAPAWNGFAKKSASIPSACSATRASVKALSPSSASATALDRNGNNWSFAPCENGFHSTPRQRHRPPVLVAYALVWRIFIQKTRNSAILVSEACNPMPPINPNHKAIQP